MLNSPDDDDFGKIYSPAEADLLRARMIDTIVKPFIATRFERFPQLQSATLLVAQYWNDEANDAVHGEIIFSVLETPDFSADDVWEIDKANSVNLPGVFSQWEIYSQGDVRYLNWDSNGMAIPAFAAFCAEGCDQEMDHREAYREYAIFRRQPDRVDVTIVGSMIRPWLNGVRPEWFEEMSEADANAEAEKWLRGEVG